MTDNLKEFVAGPFGKSMVHEAYKNSILHMRPAVETANGEMLLASVYRKLGYASVNEGSVPAKLQVLWKTQYSAPQVAPA
eukprot:COSAG01_NODE_38106_length_494_cov_0.908861_1_plen_80_part_00